MPFFRVLLLAILLGPGAALADADARPTEILDTLRITDFEPLKNTFNSPTAASFYTESGDTIWVMVHYVAEIGAAGRNGESSFEVIPLNVQVPAGQNIMLFQSNAMARVDPAAPLRVRVGDKMVELDDATLQRIMSPADYAAYRDRREPPPGLRQLVVLRRFHIPANADTAIRVEMRRQENMIPKQLEMVVGRGAIPPELTAFMDKQNGSWLYRNRVLLGIIGSVLLAAIYLQRRMA